PLRQARGRGERHEPRIDAQPARIELLGTLGEEQVVADRLDDAVPREDRRAAQHGAGPGVDVAADDGEVLVGGLLHVALLGLLLLLSARSGAASGAALVLGEGAGARPEETGQEDEGARGMERAREQGLHRGTSPKTNAPSSMTAFTCEPGSKGSPFQNTRFASLPLSRLPRRSERPSTLAGSRVTAERADCRSSPARRSSPTSFSHSLWLSTVSRRGTKAIRAPAARSSAGMLRSRRVFGERVRVGSITRRSFFSPSSFSTSKKSTSF